MHACRCTRRLLALVDLGPLPHSPSPEYAAIKRTCSLISIYPIGEVIGNGFNNSGRSITQHRRIRMSNRKHLDDIHMCRRAALGIDLDNLRNWNKHPDMEPDMNANEIARLWSGTVTWIQQRKRGVRRFDKFRKRREQRQHAALSHQCQSRV